MAALRHEYLATGFGHTGVLHRQTELERRADTRPAAQRDVAAQEAGSWRDSGRPSPDPLKRDWSGLSTCGVLVEDAMLVLDRNADAGIGNREDHGRVVGHRRRNPDLAGLVNFNAFEMKFRRTCATFPWSVVMVGMPAGSSKTRATGPNRGSAASSPAAREEARRPRKDRSERSSCRPRSSPGPAGR